MQVPWSLRILFEQHLIQQRLIEHPRCIECWQLREVLLQSSNNQTLNKTRDLKAICQAKLGSGPHSSIALVPTQSTFILPHSYLFTHQTVAFQNSAQCSRSVVLKVLSPNQQHQHHLGTSSRWQFSGFIPGLLNQKLGGWGPVPCVFPRCARHCATRTKLLSLLLGILPLL